MRCRRGHLVSAAFPLSTLSATTFISLLSSGLAYIQRSLMYHRAKCYAQAAEDAAEAVKVYQSSAQALVRRQPNGRSPDALMVTHVHRPGTTLPFRRARLDLLAWAWCAIVQCAFPASQSHLIHISILCSGMHAERLTKLIRTTPRETSWLLRDALYAHWTLTLRTRYMARASHLWHQS